jgi:predicted GTPase
MQDTLASLDRFEDSGDILSTIDRGIRDAAQETGKVNVLIAGRTGVGKSTLINEVFQGRLAQTGQGKPVTKETRCYTKQGIPLGIFDTRGLAQRSSRRRAPPQRTRTRSRAAGSGTADGSAAHRRW